jgi:hypothetical protein
VADTALLPGGTGPALGSGSGGGDWIDDDDGPNWWGWSEEPADDEPPYRGSRLRRLVAVVTAVAVVAGSMTLVAAVVAGSPTTPYTVGGVRVSASGSQAGSRTVAVHFAVTNTASEPGRATCRVLVGNPSTPEGRGTVTTPWLPSGATVAVTARVRLAGRAPSAAQARCGAGQG